MVIGAVICEFNPFHNGHKYLLDFMRNDGCDCVIAVMSTSFTQRGDVAVFSKFQRTEDALRGGADIVIELPVVWAVSSAQRFAKAGCEIIESLGCVDRVYFGSESGDISLLDSAADATIDEKVQEVLKSYMQQGDYYPTALQKAVREIYDEKISDILSSPNNILGIEYIKSLKGSGIEVKTISRAGVNHDSDSTKDSFASASKIRRDLSEGNDTSDFLPESNLSSGNCAYLNNAERAILFRLRSMNASDFENLPDVSEGLHNRFRDAIEQNTSVEAILNAVKTKRYTLARLRRILICALIGITKEIQDKSVPYLRILGYNSNKTDLLKSIFDRANLPVVMSVAKARETLEKDALKVLNLEIYATDIRTVFEDTPTPCSKDFTEPIIRI